MKHYICANSLPNGELNDWSEPVNERNITATIGDFAIVANDFVLYELVPVELIHTDNKIDITRIAINNSS